MPTPVHCTPLSESAVFWETKARVESQYPHFPDIDTAAPDFSLDEYVAVVREMLQAADVSIHPFATTWQNLTCTVPLLPAQHAVANVASIFTAAAQGLRNGFASLRPHHKDRTGPDPTHDALHDVSGYLKPGELCLVIGTPGSGTSLLLSRIAGLQMPKLVHTKGTVLYQGQEKLAGVSRPSHFTHFVRQDDVHIPQLTVRQTFQFAAECRWPAWLPHVEALRRDDVLLTAKVLGITRTLDTIVGSEILRGVSGGERKRVTMGEMGIGLISGTLVMDNWSKGLDSATTLSLCRSMRQFADATKGAVIASMQAPGTEAFQEFDTLCLLHEGHVIYFGPATEAEAYFNKLGFHRPFYRSLPDFLSTITEPKLRHEYVKSVENGNSVSEDTAPSAAEDFAACFADSKYSEIVTNTITEINGDTARRIPTPAPAVAHLAGRHALQSPRFQIKAMARRQLRWLLSVRGSVISQLIQNLIFGIVLGSVFWQLPNTNGGAETRGGIIFLTLLFIALSALAAVQSKYEEKVVFTKQREASFFDAWTYLLTQAVFDFVLELLKAICLILPLYLMAGLEIGSSGQRLIFAIVLSTFVSLTVISLTRFLVAALDDPNAAEGVAGLLMIIMALFSGFWKSSGEIQDWLIWIYWINPLTYAFEALVINEYDGLQFACDPEELLPPNPAIPQESRICPVTTGTAYLSDNLDIDHGQIFRLYYFLVVVGFNTLFFIASAFATANAKPRGHAQSASSSNSVHVTTPRGDGETAVDVNEDGTSDEPKTRFTFSKMRYAVNDGSKVLLDDVTGNAVSGKVVLLMGESGAGKTTLLDVCAMRKTLGHGSSVSGEIRVNGKLLDKKALSFVSGYCEQNDLHIGEATVREAVLFSAKLRLPKSMATDEKKRRVEETISILGLEAYSNVLVKALGSGELKLLTMAVEVVADPKVLFLDEPTSGISSSSAMTVAKVLRNVAGSGTCVICTVHQPSKEVFTMFDRLLLLKRGGVTVYFGDIGENGSTLRSYFESRGAPAMSPEVNPADWMLEVISDEKTNWAEEWKASKEKGEMDEETVRYAKPDDDSPEESEDGKKSDRPGLVRQSVEVIRRQFWRYWRLPEYNTTRIILMLNMALIFGLFFLREIDNTQRGAQLAFGALFLTLVPSNLAAENVIDPTAGGRAVFYREVAAGIYRSVAHHIAVGLVEVPFTFVATTVFSLVFYFMVGLEESRFFYYFLAAHLIYTFAVMFGLMLASITPSPVLARILVTSIFSIFHVLSGFFIRKPEMPVWWRWFVWVNPFAYYLAGLLRNQMQDQVFVCEEGEFLEFELPPNFESCGAIPDSDYDSIVRGGTTFCQFCPIPNGNVLIESFEADEVNKWIALVALLVAIMICRVVTGFGFARLRFLTR